MICVILSAGMGKRLMPLTKDLPKPLLEIDGMTLLERMIVNCINVNITDFILVAGYNKDKVYDIAPKLEDKYQISITIIDNDEYDVTNTSVSAYLASSYIEKNSLNDFILINGDNVVEAEIIERIAKTAGTGLVVDNYKDLNEESFKLIIDDDGTIKEIGKEIDIPASTGEFIGISKLAKQDISRFNEILSGLIKKDRQNYYDFAFKPLSNMTEISYVMTNGLEWTEIDDDADWKRAKRLIENFKNKY